MKIPMYFAGMCVEDVAGCICLIDRIAIPPYIEESGKINRGLFGVIYGNCPDTNRHGFLAGVNILREVPKEECNE